VTFSPETVYDEIVHPLEPTRMNVEPKLLRMDAPGEVLVSERIVLGRDVKQATLVVDHDPFVSRVHAIVDDDGEWRYVDDGGSMNGTFVNGIQIHGRHPLRHGDKLRLGRTVTWEFVDGSEDTTAVEKGR
jgi:pSer/pThr/pTyr-binding forkhead associated (FHA) protein